MEEKVTVRRYDYLISCLEWDLLIGPWRRWVKHSCRCVPAAYRVGDIAGAIRGSGMVPIYDDPSMIIGLDHQREWHGMAPS